MADFPEWQHKYTATKPYAGDGYGSKAQIRVEAGLYYLQGNKRPYFSVTGEIFIPGRRDFEAGGCLHDEIVRHWPELAPVIALHLSDDQGDPMHAEANGWCQLAGYYGGAGERYHAGNGKIQHWKPGGVFDGYRESTPEECLVSFAEHVRISVDEARQLAEQWRANLIPSRLVHPADILPAVIAPEDWRPVRAAFRAWLEAQRERYAAQVQAAIETLDRLIAGV